MGKKPFIIYKSSAGSGKTYTLSKNYIRLALKNPGYFKRILAVTFTNKAAEQMKSRILEMVHAMSMGEEKELIIEFSKFYKVSLEEVMDRAKKLESNILHNYSYFSITTIDTFFYSIIQAFIRDLKFRGVYKIEIDQKLVINEVVENFLLSIKKGSDLSRWLIEFSREKLREEKDFMIVQELKNMTKNLFEEDYKKVSRDLVNRDYKDHVKKLRSHIYKTRKKFQKDVSNRSELLYNDIISSGFVIEDFKFKKTGVAGFIYNSSRGIIKEPGVRVLQCIDSLDAWRKKTFDRKDELDILIKTKLLGSLEEIVSLYQSDYEYYSTACELSSYVYSFGILGELSKKIIEYRDVNEVILISDLSELLNEIIKDENIPFVFEKVGNTFNNFLIDEFQDTSNFQWENFKPLIRESLSSGDENLIVGDIKQSIYRWRGSDSSIMEHNVELEMNRDELSVNHLKNNWRSGEVIVNYNNTLFSTISDSFSDEKIGEYVGQVFNRNLFQEIIPEKKNKGYVEIQFSKQERFLSQSAIDFTVGNIKKIQDAGYSAGDIGIIVRDKNEARVIAEELIRKSLEENEYNFNHVSADALDIKSAPVVRFFISVFNYFLNKKDRLALSEIVHFYVSRVLKKCETNHFAFSNENKLTLLPKEFKENRNIISRLPIYELSETIIRIFKLNTLINQIPYLQSFQDLIFDFKRNNNGDIITFLRWWRDNNSKKLQLTEQKNAIRLITIHKSKGLEFNHVIIPFCDWNLDDNSKGFKEKILWVNLKKFHPDFDFPYPIKYKSKHPKSIFSDVYDLEKKKAYVDNINLLYVAFTRPKIGLFVHAKKSGDNIKNVSDLLYTNLSKKINDKGDYDIYMDGSLVNKSSDNDQNNLFSSVRYPSELWSGRVRVKKSRDEEIYNTENKNRGKIIHDVLYYIKNYNDFQAGIDTAIKKNIITTSEREEYLKIIGKIFSNKDIRPFFDPKLKSENEVEVLDQRGDLYRMDRLVETKSDILEIIDYKTGEVEDDHRIQVENYKKILQSIDNKKIRAHLIYLDLNKIISV